MEIIILYEVKIHTLRQYVCMTYKNPNTHTHTKAILFFIEKSFPQSLFFSYVGVWNASWVTGLNFMIFMFCVDLSAQKWLCLTGSYHGANDICKGMSCMQTFLCMMVIIHSVSKILFSDEVNVACHRTCVLCVSNDMTFSRAG